MPQPSFCPWSTRLIAGGTRDSKPELRRPSRAYIGVLTSRRFSTPCTTMPKHTVLELPALGCSAFHQQVSELRGGRAAQSNKCMETSPSRRSISTRMLHRNKRRTIGGSLRVRKTPSSSGGGGGGRSRHHGEIERASRCRGIYIHMLHGGYRVVCEVEAALQTPLWGQKAKKCSGRCSGAGVGIQDEGRRRESLWGMHLRHSATRIERPGSATSPATILSSLLSHRFNALDLYV
jgi:hypothetical protein